MGKPAARLGDTANTCNDPTDMPVGKVIAAGTVMINKIPAAKQGDKIVGVDIHIIMIPSPGGPVPTPLPHPFNGIINTGCSTSVKIMGMPAATVDSVANNMPPHIPQGGPFQKPPMNQAKIIMGSTNVFIGNGGGGGGSGGGGEQKKKEATSQAAAKGEGHFLHAKFVDKGGNPISGTEYRIKDPDGNETDGVLTGEVKRQGVKEGSHEIKLRAITKAAWSTEEAVVGDKVKLQVETVGFESGEEAELEIFIRDTGFADRSLCTIDTELEGDKIEEEWQLDIDEDYLDIQKTKGNNYSYPNFYFMVRIANSIARSGILSYKDWIEIELKDEEGNAIKNRKFKAFLSNGEVRQCQSDANGKTKLEKIPPGHIKIKIES